MSDVKVGTAVVPVNGRYGGRKMVAIEVCAGYAKICDGRRRRIGKPKRKKLCHLSVISPDAPRLEVNAGLTDGAVRRYLASLPADANIPDD
ncbi:MAG: hypothetical protein IKN38_00895 [Clostridia bacterium]|nr:hypothetical protein [Clostridia bacterium]